MSDTVNSQLDGYDFGFPGYQPMWTEFKAIRSHAQGLFSQALGRCLLDIKGVVSSDGWEPDWPVVLKFGDLSISINTKCDFLWALDRWQDWNFDQEYANSEPDHPLCYNSLIDLLDLSDLINQPLSSVYVRPIPAIEDFALTFNSRALIIGNGGDQLYIRMLSDGNLDASSWELLFGPGKS